MSDKIKDGGPAFPTLLTGKWAGSETNATFAPDMTDGMSLRDWFAGMALQGYIASVTQSPDRKDTAIACYEYADAMLINREKGVKP